MRKIWIPMSLAALLAIASVSAADKRSPSPRPSASPSPKVVMKKSELHKFSGTHFKGELKKPELGYIYQRKGLRAEKIVNIPEDFNEEIINGAGQF